MCLWERLFIETHNVSKGEAVRGRSSLNYLFLHNFGNLSKVKDTFREIIASKTSFDLNVRAPIKSSWKLSARLVNCWPEQARAQ